MWIAWNKPTISLIVYHVIPHYTGKCILRSTLDISSKSPKHHHRCTINTPAATSPFHHFRTISLSSSALHFQDLALSQKALEESFNKGVVTALYDALKRHDAGKIQEILAADLEWWFHGPPSHQFLMRVLTGDKESHFHFVPHSISAFGHIVLAEGFDQSRSIAWVHAWTVADGIITQVREYFNTSLTVTRFGKSEHSEFGISSLHRPSVWESSFPDRVGKSVPGLVLAI